ncbi:MAG: phage shock protein PspC (stress-responsive transcriptional regulator) [Polaribacter sp.]|jgi:phage shock protein PspC (stress-responsive transcriptional regulator)
MNKVFNINLGGYPFTIDEDAYEHLNQYLDAIHGHFRKSEGYEDITTDIEDRMAELFQDLRDGRPIVTLKTVTSAIDTMGTPEEFGAEAVGASTSSPEEDDEPLVERDFGVNPGKRLFRNPDDQVIKGVCSGIAAYFGIGDPLWVRLAFVLLTISGGLGIPLYLILWAVLPQAVTSADRLAMKGQPINVSNIAKTVEEEMDSLSEKLADLSEGFTSKKKALVEPSALGRPLRKGFLF